MHQLTASRSSFFHDMPPPRFDFSLTAANFGRVLDNFSLSSASFRGCFFPMFTPCASMPAYRPSLILSATLRIQGTP